jgi:hypothetical protein
MGFKVPIDMSKSTSSPSDSSSENSAKKPPLPGTIDGFEDGLKTATIDRLGLPIASVGSGFAFEFLASIAITPFLTERPEIPDDFTPYIGGFGGGFVSGTIVRKFLLKKIGVPSIIDTVMTVSNINKTAVKIDRFLDQQPTVKAQARGVMTEVWKSASKQHQRTNPYMTPNDPESMAEIQSPF